MIDGWFYVGLAAQALFSARFLVQWLASERARRSVMPPAFWYFSVSGSAVLLVYAAARRDPVFILCQVINLGVYLRNLQLLRRERRGAVRAPEGKRTEALLFSGLAAAVLAGGILTWWSRRVGGAAAPSLFWLLFGFCGQLIFNARFALQLLHSERAGKSIVPLSFWYCSMVGSAMLFLYAVARRDPIFMLAQGPNLLVYGRNLQLLRRERATRSDAPPGPGAPPKT